MNRISRTIQNVKEVIKEKIGCESNILMSNLAKSDTGLRIVVWIFVKSPKQLHCKPIMKFANNYSDCLLPKDLVTISIADNPQILSKRAKLRISDEDIEKLRLWIIGNKEALMQVWNAEISILDFNKKMKRQSEEYTLSEDLRLCEIGIVGIIGNLIVYVWPQYGGDIPIFFIGDALTFPDCTQFKTAIKIESAEYFTYSGQYTDKLNSEQREELMHFLNAKDDNYKNGDFLREIWNHGNSKQVSYPQPIPDYTKLK